MDASGNAYWLLTDRMGSVRDVIDSTGAVKDHINYDGFGNIISETDASYRGRYAWTGRELDTETGLQYNRARYYDPKTGRWTSQDPLGFDAGDSNLYRYLANGGVNGSDPSGLQEPTVRNLVQSPQNQIRCVACHNPLVLAGVSLNNLPENFQIAAMKWYGVDSPGIADAHNFALKKNATYRFSKGVAQGMYEQAKIYTIITGPAGFLRDVVADPVDAFDELDASIRRDPWEHLGGKTSGLVTGVLFGAAMPKKLNSGGASTSSELASSTIRSAHSPVNGIDWFRNFEAAYGAGNVEWTSISNAGRSSIGSALHPSVPVYPGSGPAVGIFEFAGIEIPLQAGSQGPGSTLRSVRPAGPGSGLNAAIPTHVEGHVAGIMHELAITEGNLYINLPPCPTSAMCRFNLHKILPHKSTLNVYFLESGGGVSGWRFQQGVSRWTELP